uniref:Uncharacterized protein n=1 Tax=Tetraselmis sp. GSL018 TaxID=582737 RepID=A0A061QGJ5_9CHLO
MVFKFNFAVGESAKAETDGEKSGSASSRECAEANLKPFSEVFPELDCRITRLRVQSGVRSTALTA